MNQPFFRRGPAPLVRLVFYIVVSLAMLLLDTRWHTMERLRWSLGIAVQPAQVVVQAPMHWLDDLSDYVTDVNQLREENKEYRQHRLESTAALLRLEHLENENDRLRRLLEVKVRERIKGQVARILYAARDPFARRIVVDRGEKDGIAAGLPVIDDKGLVGQVTRTYPLVSEVTLITDKNQAVPVQVVRNGLRSVLYGLGDGRMELRFLPTNADVQEGDMLVTSGLDGVYLPGLPVAKVAELKRDVSYAFAQIWCAPAGGVENHDEVMILQGREPPPPSPAPVQASPAEKPSAKGSKGTAKGSGKDKNSPSAAGKKPAHSSSTSMN